MKRALKIIAGVLLGIVLFSIGWSFAYPRLFPERMLAQQTRMRCMFLGSAAVESFRLHSRWPESVQDLVAHPDGTNGNMAMFLRAASTTHGAIPSCWRNSAEHRVTVALISYGADGQPGGEGIAGDIIMHYGNNQIVPLREEPLHRSSIHGQEQNLPPIEASATANSRR
jgi:hypothetical protein